MYKPRRYTRRTPKWQKLYGGPFLIVRQTGPVNFAVQKSRRAVPEVVHVDKLKAVKGRTPVSWLGEPEEEATGPAGFDTVAEEESEEEVGAEMTGTGPEQIEMDLGITESEEDGSGPLVGKRQRRTPRRLADYVCE